MRYVLLTFALIIPLCTVFSQTPLTDPHWELLWEDHFNTLNTDIWNVRNNYDHWGYEWQVYRDNNVRIDNGVLVLEG